MSEEDRTPRRRRRTPEKVFVGCILMAIGGMMALLCGACTVLSSTIILSAAVGNNSGSGLATLILPAILGGVPTILGVFIFRAGLRMYSDA